MVGNHLPCCFLPSFSSLLFFLAFGFYFFYVSSSEINGDAIGYCLSPPAAAILVSLFVTLVNWGTKHMNLLQLFGFLFFLFISLYLIWNRLYSLFECDSPFPLRQPSASYKLYLVWNSLFCSVYICLYDWVLFPFGLDIPNRGYLEDNW